MIVSSDHKPEVIEEVGNGSINYNYDIEEVEKEMGPDVTVKEWQYESVQIWKPITANKITKEVITDKWGIDHEQKLLNEYNAALMGIYTDEEAELKKTNYTNYLTERKRIKEQIDKDCKDLNIQ